MHAEIVRLSLHHVDIKIVKDEQMHVLQWRRNLLWDEVLLDGKRQASSHGLFGREKVYGLVFGRDEEGKGGQRSCCCSIPPLMPTGPKAHSASKASGLRVAMVRSSLTEHSTPRHSKSLQHLQIG